MERYPESYDEKSDAALERRVAALENRARRVAAVITWALAYGALHGGGNRPIGRAHRPTQPRSRMRGGAMLAAMTDDDAGGQGGAGGDALDGGGMEQDGATDTFAGDPIGGGHPIRPPMMDSQVMESQVMEGQAMRSSAAGAPQAAPAMLSNPIGGGRPVRPPLSLEERVETLETMSQVVGDVLSSDDD